MQRRRRSNSVSLTDLDLSQVRGGCVCGVVRACLSAHKVHQVTSEEEVSDDDDRIGSLVDGEVADYAQELAKIREQLDQCVAAAVVNAGWTLRSRPACAVDRADWFA